MARQKRVLPENVTPALLKSREKRKWQIALRRYVVLKQPSIAYAPYFGLDIDNLRAWFEMQFTEGITWDDFATKWQFDHIIPVACFDFSFEEELSICWNFTNIRVDLFHPNKKKGTRVDLLAAKAYFETLYTKTRYLPCHDLLAKIERLELIEKLNSVKQEAFITKHRPYLDMIEHYSSFEFELLNAGHTIEEVIKEVNFLKKF
jgi:5-methylcytosine-specific restriction endonuclease McrA